EALLVGSLLIGVAGCTTDFLWRGLVGSGLYVGMAIHTREHAAVNGIFELLRVNVQAFRFAVDLVRQGGVAVAGETLIGSRFGGVFFFCGEEWDTRQKTGA